MPLETTHTTIINTLCEFVNSVGCEMEMEDKQAIGRIKMSETCMLYWTEQWCKRPFKSFGINFDCGSPWRPMSNDSTQLTGPYLNIRDWDERYVMAMCAAASDPRDTLALKILPPQNDKRPEHQMFEWTPLLCLGVWLGFTLRCKYLRMNCVYAMQCVDDQQMKINGPLGGNF